MKQYFDKIRLYAIELIVSIWAIVVGITIMLPDTHLDTFLWRNHEQTHGFMFVLTGIVSLIGIFWNGKNIDTEWLLIRIGLVVSAFVWLSYGLILGWSGFALALINIVLFLRLLAKEREVRKHIES